MNNLQTKDVVIVLDPQYKYETEEQILIVNGWTNEKIVAAVKEKIRGELSDAEFVVVQKAEDMEAAGKAAVARYGAKKFTVRVCTVVTGRGFLEIEPSAYCWHVKLEI